MNVIKSEMEWTRFKELFEASDDPTSRSLDEDDDRNFSTVGAELYLDHANASREASKLHSSDDYEIERPQSVSREPSGLLYTDENEIESPQISFAMSDLQFTRTNSLIEDLHPLDDDDQENIASLVATSTINYTFDVQLDDLPYLGQQASEGSFEIRVRQAELEMETSGRSICASSTRSSLGGVADDESRENSELSVDCIVSDWFHDEIISSDEALDSATEYKTATPSSSLESDEVIIEERAERCVDFGNSENECAKDVEYENENEIKQHLRWFGHGKPWTLIAIFVSWAGVVLAAYSRNSLQFVTLDDPLLIDSNYDYVDSIGMIRIQVCYNETVVGQNGCQIIDLSPELVDDSRFEAARILLTLGLWFGIFFATLISTAIYWESINLRPIGFGLLFTYFCQSCAMLFFDTELCATNTCRPGAGCIYCIVASFCWFTACGATAKMDAIKSGHARRRGRQALREANRAAKAIRKKLYRETKAIRKKLEQEASSATEQTASTTSSNSSQHTADIESGEDNELRKVQLNRKASTASEKTTSDSASMYEC
jgi:Skp family chaperone for outer membrane proteins